jgi:hypothetical protein
MRTLPAMALTFSLTITIVGCQGKQNHGLPQFQNVDRVVVGEIKYYTALAEVTDPAEVERITRFANSKRASSWTEIATIHGRGSTAFKFYSGGSQVGYLAIGGEYMYTNAKDMEARLPLTAEDRATFLSLVPHAASAPRMPGPRSQRASEAPR